MTCFEEPFNYKGMPYWGDCATVYYYSDAGGEKVEFEKKDGIWIYKTTLTDCPVRGGSADDYFVFPCFKKPLF